MLHTVLGYNKLTQPLIKIPIMDRLLKSNFTWLTKSPHSKNMQTLVIFKSAEFSPAAAIGDLTVTHNLHYGMSLQRMVA